MYSGIFETTKARRTFLGRIEPRDCCAFKQKTGENRPHGTRSDAVSAPVDFANPGGLEYLKAVRDSMREPERRKFRPQVTQLVLTCPESATTTPEYRLTTQTQGS